MGIRVSPIQEMILLKGVMGSLPLDFPSYISAANAAQGFPELALMEAGSQLSEMEVRPFLSLF